MKDKFNNFFNKWNGKPCEVNDPSNLNQCMDLAYAWCDELEVPRDAIRHLYAYEVYTKPNDITIKYFEMVPNTALAVPKVGDLVVFKGGTAGHISIRSEGASDTNSFESFDQNFGNTVNKCGLIRHPYDNVLGFLRFRVEKEPEITEQTILPIIDAHGKKMEVQAVRSKLADQDNEIAKLKTDKDYLLRDIDNLNIEKEALNTHINNLEGLPNAIHDVLYGSGWWWVKWAKIKKLVPEQS